MKRTFLFFIALTWAFVLPAQTASEDTEQPSSNVDSRFNISPGERFDIIFSRMVAFNNTAESSDLNYELVPARSGSYSVGFSYGFPFGRTVALRFEPRATWQKFYYVTTEDKNFPSSLNDSLIYEKHRMFYLEAPLGIRLNFVRDSQDKVKFYTEFGTYGGINLGSAIKQRFRSPNPLDNSLSTRTTVKYHHIPDLEFLRYGFYARVGISWLAFELNYRASNIFDPDATFYPDGGVEAKKYPLFNPWMAGFLITI